MKTVFKPLGLAAAVAAVTAGYAGAVSAQAVSARNVGDLGIIPFYTVNSGYATAIHILNTSEATQVVKLRARRGSDSSDSLDFNIIMSPKDVWVGSMTKQADDSIVITSNDNTCTAPAGTPNGAGGVEYRMPDDESITTLVNYRTGGEEGYIEIIAMAQPVDESQPIAVAAEHDSDGVPADCGLVRSNFFRNPGADVMSADLDEKGVVSPSFTLQTCDEEDASDCDNSSARLNDNDYTDSQDDALKVSWAVTSAVNGLEFGSNAVHIEGFADQPMMTNQQVIVTGVRDPLGYLFPDLDGGSPGFGPTRGLYDDVIRRLLGVPSVQNDWSSRGTQSFEVATDWVVTMPGQYLMVQPGRYRQSLETSDLPDDDNRKIYCYGASVAAAEGEEECDFRDIPVLLDVTYYNREEGSFTPEEGGLVVSPAINVSPLGINLPYEVNVIEWSVNAEAILNSQYGVSFAPLFEDDRGWADLGVIPSTVKNQRIWNYGMDGTDPNDDFPEVITNTAVPLVGYAVWQRAFAATPQANYGRAIDHSYGSVAP